MPSLKASAVELSDNYRSLAPEASVSPVPHPPIPPAHATQSSVMISSMPSVSTSSDGITRQFYGGRNLPTRRISLPA